MASITQEMWYRLSLIKYTEKYDVTKAAIKNQPLLFKLTCVIRNQAHHRHMQT